MSWDDFDFVRNVVDQAGSMRGRHPDRDKFDCSSAGEDQSHFMGRMPHWPDGMEVRIPVRAGSELPYPGEVGLTIGYEHGSSQFPFLASRNSISSRVGGAATPFTVDVISWLQSNRSSGQLPLGGKFPSYVYEPDTGSYSNRWALPTRYNTDDDPENVERKFLAYGLGRWQPDAGDDLWITGYPQKDPSGGWGVAIGAWGVTSRSQAWEAGFGSGDGTPIPQPANRSMQFFADQLAKAASVLPDLNSTPSRICTARNDSDHHQTDLDKFPWNASIHSFRAADPEHPTELAVNSYLVLPLTNSSNPTIDFWKMNQASLEWTKEASFNAVDVPNGGADEVSDILETGTDQTGPVAWTANNEALIPVAGGQRDILNPDNWYNVHWTVRGIKPDGTAGTRLASKTIAGSSSPRILANASFQTQVLTAPFPLTYEWTGIDSLDSPGKKVYGGIELGPTTDSFCAKFVQVPPVFMPPAGPNMSHLPKSQGLEARMAYSYEKHWPSDTVTRPGGMVMDDEDTAWFSVLEPEPVLYYSSHTGNIPGGEIYSKVDSGNTATVYYWTYFENATECFAGVNGGHGWNVNSTVHPVLGSEVSTDPDSWSSYDQEIPCLDTDGYRRRSYSMEDKGSRAVWKFQLNLGLGFFWRTKLYGLKSNNSLVEIDISQKQDVEVSASFGSSAAGGPGSGLESFTVTESNVPTPDAVWQLLPVLKGTQRLIAVLRDLHEERDGDCQPAPVIEIRDLGAAGNVLSTIRLGSQERREDFFLSESGEYSYSAGDNVWNPYSRGAPRMKACRDADGNPVILTIVAETKVVDVESEIQARRLCYASIRLNDPENPEVVTQSRTVEAESVGEDPVDFEDGYYPLWEDWDTLTPTSGDFAWLRESNFFDLVP